MHGSATRVDAMICSLECDELPRAVARERSRLVSHAVPKPWLDRTTDPATHHLLTAGHGTGGLLLACRTARALPSSTAAASTCRDPRQGVHVTDRRSGSASGYVWQACANECRVPLFPQIHLICPHPWTAARLISVYLARLAVRVLNALRSLRVGCPLTWAQYDALGPGRLLRRLLALKLHQLALALAHHLRLPILEAQVSAILRFTHACAYTHPQPSHTHTLHPLGSQVALDWAHTIIREAPASLTDTALVEQLRIAAGTRDCLRVF